MIDSEDRALISASVTALNEATGLSRSVETDGGGFRLASLPPGSYTVVARAGGFKTFEQKGLALNVGRTAELNIRLEVGGVRETVEVTSGADAVGVSREGRVADTFTRRESTELPLVQRDIFLLPKLSAGATAIPGAANSTKLSNSPVVTVNGNRYRGNNYVLDGSMNTNPNNTGEPAIIPSLESVEEVQVQTSNFSAEFGRGNWAVVNLRDCIRFDQYLVRIDHSFNKGLDKPTGRWIGERQRDEGGTSSSTATLGQAGRGMRGPFKGSFGNLNLGYMRVFGRNVNDLRFSFQNISTVRGSDGAVVPQITVTGLTAPFGDVFNSGTRLRTYEVRDTFTLDLGRHTLRMGGEVRRLFKALSIGPASAGTFSFNSVSDLVGDRPFRQTLAVDPATGRPTGFPRYFTLYETGLFVQDDWKPGGRLNLSLGLRHDYFGTATDREGRVSSIVLGPGATFNEHVANAAVGRVGRLYTPEKLNLSPRVGVAYDPFGDGRTSVRAGFSLAFQPHHGQSITGARALPPDAAQVVSQPSTGIGTRILYNIPVPFNPEFARGLNPRGGINPLPGETARIRPTGFVVNPTIKTQYSESFFLNAQRQLGGGGSRRWATRARAASTSNASTT